MGADLGRVTTSLAVGRRGRDGALEVLLARARRHHGSPLAPLFGLYEEIGAEALTGLVATGVHSDRVGGPALGGLPEEVAQEQAAALLWPAHGPLTIVRLGGSGFSVLALDGAGGAVFEQNDRCSAGAGESLERLCARLGRTLEEAVDLAQRADQSVVVTARCAVFAKSELTHFANQGEPHGRLFRGQFESLAANVYGLLGKVRTGERIVAVGHGARIAPVVAELGRLTGVRVEVPAEAGVFEALGALALAAAREWPSGQVWPPEAGALERPSRRRIVALQPADECGGEVVQLVAAGSQGMNRLQDPDRTSAAATAERRGPGNAASLPRVLGLDLGSTGSKAVLLDAADGGVIASVYRRTAGNPVEAAAGLITELLADGSPAVVAVGLTGSGRDAMASVVRAAYPEIGKRLCVENEIVAHAAAAVRHDPDGGRSLSIVEIGGQDAKFINVRNGRVVDADMNRVCSAGTGSFLEEQAEALGVDDIAAFGPLAAASRRPPDLGQTCTVFVADVAAEAMDQGFSRDDVFAGLQYSVVRNYCSRVMGQRRFLDRVFFQGKPASNASLARTLAAVTGRTVCVPPDPGAMGAIGIAMLAREGLRDDAQSVPDGESLAFAQVGLNRLDLARLLDARIVERREFRCRDSGCDSLCRIESAVVEIAGERRTVTSGGNCPKYDVTSAVAKLPKGTIDPFRERGELLERTLAAAMDSADEQQARNSPARGPLIGLPYAHYLVDSLPFFYTLLVSLGAQVRVLRSGRKSLIDGDRRCRAPGACAPVKIAHALIDADVDAVFLPKLVNIPYANAGHGQSTCPMTQGTPEMLEWALRDEGIRTPVLRPPLFIEQGGGWASRSLAEELSGLPALLESLSTEGWKAASFPRAFRRAMERQRAFEEGLEAIGERSLRAAQEAGVPVVIVAGETHIIHEPLLNPGIQRLIAANGAIPVPVDCVPVPAGAAPLARLHWASAGRILRSSVALAQSGQAYPMLLGAYGCGPNSFIEHLFNDLFEDYPHIVLETDGHGGVAGYVTRVQAFLHAVRAHRAEQVRRASGSVVEPAVPAARIARLDAPMPHTFNERELRRIYFGNVGGGVGRQVAAAMRGEGLDARYLGDSDAEALHCSQGCCSGKECLPYQLLWGSLARFVQKEGMPEEESLLLSVGNGFRSCRANLFPITQQIGLERMGLDGRVRIGDLSMLTDSLTLTPVVWAALVANDLLLTMRFYHEAGEAERGAAAAVFAHWARGLESTLEQPRAGATGVMDAVLRVERVVEGAARDFSRLPSAANGELRDVFLCGDIFLRIDEWGNDELQRRLSDLGLRVIIEPYAEFFELVALRDAQENGPATRKGALRRATLRATRLITRRLMAAARRHEPWLFWNDVARLEAESRSLLDGFPFGESISTIGSALLTWRTQPVDGVVVVGPRGCGPALISEAQLRHSDIPALFVYNDGDPLDESRLAGFAWRLRSQPARRRD